MIMYDDDEAEDHIIDSEDMILSHGQSNYGLCMYVQIRYKDKIR